MLAPWKKNYNKPRENIEKQRHHFTDKDPCSQSYGFSTSGCESWTIKKAEYWEIDAFESWCWRRLSRVPWTARRSNQSILNQAWLFIRRTDVEAETNILATQCKKLIHWKKTLMLERLSAGVTEVGWHHQFNGHDSEQTPGDSEGQGSQACYNHGVAKNWTLLSNWTITRNQHRKST